jgi:hypothetical protein
MIDHLLGATGTHRRLLLGQCHAMQYDHASAFDREERCRFAIEIIAFARQGRTDGCYSGSAARHSIEGPLRLTAKQGVALR